MSKTSQSPQIPRQRPYKRADLLDRYNVDRKTLWRWEQDGTIPKPSFYLGSTAYWKPESIDQIEDSPSAAAQAS